MSDPRQTAIVQALINDSWLGHDEPLNEWDLNAMAEAVLRKLDAYDREHPEQVPWLKKVDNWEPEMGSDGAPFLAHHPTYRVRTDG